MMKLLTGMLSRIWNLELRSLVNPRRELVDPEYYRPGHIDMLIGAVDVYGKILLDGRQCATLATYYVYTLVAGIWSSEILGNRRVANPLTRKRVMTVVRWMWYDFHLTNRSALLETQRRQRLGDCWTWKNALTKTTIWSTAANLCERMRSARPHAISFSYSPKSEAEVY